MPVNSYVGAVFGSNRRACDRRAILWRAHEALLRDLPAESGLAPPPEPGVTDFVFVCVLCFVVIKMIFVNLLGKTCDVL